MVKSEPGSGISRTTGSLGRRRCIASSLCRARLSGALTRAFSTAFIRTTVNGSTARFVRHSPAPWGTIASTASSLPDGEVPHLHDRASVTRAEGHPVRMAGTMREPWPRKSWSNWPRLARSKVIPSLAAQAWASSSSPRQISEWRLYWDAPMLRCTRQRTTDAVATPSTPMR